MSTIASDAPPPQEPDGDAALESLVNPPAACPGCLARAEIPWPEGTTSLFCRACLDRMRRVYQCAHWNADREHQSAAGKASWVAAVARWWAGCGEAPPTVEAAKRYVTPNDICGPHRLELSPELRDEIYHAWCAGYLYPVRAWFSDEPPPDLDGLWISLGMPDGPLGPDGSKLIYPDHLDN